MLTTTVFGAWSETTLETTMLDGFGVIITTVRLSVLPITATMPLHRASSAGEPGASSSRTMDNRLDIVWHVDTSQSGDPGKRNGVFRAGCKGRQGILDAFADEDFLGPRVAEADEAVNVPVVRAT